MTRNVHDAAMAIMDHAVEKEDLELVKMAADLYEAYSIMVQALMPITLLPNIASSLKSLRNLVEKKEIELS